MIGRLLLLRCRRESLGEQRGLEFPVEFRQFADACLHADGRARDQPEEIHVLAGAEIVGRPEAQRERNARAGQIRNPDVEGLRLQNKVNFDFGQILLKLLRQQRQVDPIDIHGRKFEVQREAVSIAGLLHQLLGLRHVRHRIGQISRARVAGRYRRRQHLSLAVDGEIDRTLVIDRQSQGLPDLQRCQHLASRGNGTKRHVDEVIGGHCLENNIRVVNTVRGVGIDLHRDIGRTRLQHLRLGDCIRGLLEDDTADMGLGGPVIVVPRQPHGVVGPVALQREGSASGGMREEPLVGGVAGRRVAMVAGTVSDGKLAVDDTGIGGRQDADKFRVRRGHGDDDGCAGPAQ